MSRCRNNPDLSPIENRKINQKKYDNERKLVPVSFGLKNENDIKALNNSQQIKFGAFVKAIMAALTCAQIKLIQTNNYAFQLLDKKEICTNQQPSVMMDAIISSIDKTSSLEVGLHSSEIQKLIDQAYSKGFDAGYAENQSENIKKLHGDVPQEYYDAQIG